MNNEKIVKRIDFPVVGITMVQGESGFWQCPVCGEFTLDDPFDNMYCPTCDAPNNEIFLGGLNGETDVTLDEAKKQWKNKGKVDWNWKVWQQ